jgi:hypothetical protein
MEISGTLSGKMALALLVCLPVAAQSERDGTRSKEPSQPKPWTTPLTPDGQPDLQGVWVSRSATPLERPKELEGRPFLTDAEVAELTKRAARIFSSGRSDYPAGDQVFMAALQNVEQFQAGKTATSVEMIEREFDARTSLIVDPPDGKIPPLTEAGQQRQAAVNARVAVSQPPSSPKDLANFVRCITFGVPRLGGNFGAGPYSYYQIVQTPGYVMILMEAIHDARIIPLDGRPHLPPSVRTWDGDSRAKWEGQTLIIDTTNFSPKSNFMGSAENLHLVERFTRVASNEIDYEITLDDPTTWTKPWTAMLRLKQTSERIYEYACHEGNRVMEEILRVARSQDKAEQK